MREVVINGQTLKVDMCCLLMLTEIIKLLNANNHVDEEGISEVLQELRYIFSE